MISSYFFNEIFLYLYSLIHLEKYTLQKTHNQQFKGIDDLPEDSIYLDQKQEPNSQQSFYSLGYFPEFRTEIG